MTTALKQAVASAALDYCLSCLRKEDALGIGSGSTTACFISLLGAHKARFRCAVSSSTTSTQLLQQQGIEVIELSQAGPVRCYVDGADEVTDNFHLMKGGGGALVREKIIAHWCDEFVCIVDESKWVDCLGGFPLPVEYIPMAYPLMVRLAEELGGKAIKRAGVVSDNGNPIIDIHGLTIADAYHLESTINQVAGVVENGIFAKRTADRIFSASTAGVRCRVKNN